MRQAMMFSKRGTSSAEVTAAIAAAQGGDQMEFVETCSPLATTSATDTANQASFHRVRVGKPLTVSQMTVFIGTASGNIDLAIYQSDGTTLTRLASTGSTAAAGTNALQTINLSASVTLQPGIDYYLAISKDNATVTMARLSLVGGAVGGYKNRYVRVLSTFPLPATQSVAGLIANGVAWWIAAA